MVPRAQWSRHATGGSQVEHRQLFQFFNRNPFLDMPGDLYRADSRAAHHGKVPGFPMGIGDINVIALIAEGRQRRVLLIYPWTQNQQIPGDVLNPADRSAYRCMNAVVIFIV